MSALLQSLHLWIVSAHVIAVMFWMGALYYLPRLFVYHAQTEAASPQAAVFTQMEARLLRIIATPSMLAAWVFGLLLLATPGTLGDGQGWIIAKLVLVLALSGFHGACAKWQKAFARGENAHTPRFYRIINEIGPVLTIPIVILVIVKPF